MRFRAPSSKSRFFLRLALPDIVWLILSPLIALYLRSESYLDWPDFPHALPTTYQYAFATALASLAIFILMRVGDSLPHLFTSRDSGKLLGACGLCVLSGVFVSFTLSHAEGVARSVPLIYGLVLTLGVFGYRLLARSFAREKSYDRETTRFDMRRVIIIGLDAFSINAIKLTDAQRPRTVQVVAALSLDGKYSGRSLNGVRVVGSSEDLTKIIDEYHIHGVDINELWVSDALPEINPELYQRLLSQAQEKSLSQHLISSALGLSPRGAPVAPSAADHRLLAEVAGGYFRLKRLLDVVVSLLLLVLLLPLYLILLPLLILDVGFPLVFWQERVGRFGRVFQIYKFRTLKHPIGPGGQILSDAARLSPLGRFMRKYRFDEYPQLINILKGDMSGIGPRPFITKEQPEDISYRSLIRPGISGWAQINGGDELSQAEKNILDIYYVFNASLMFDLKIVYKSCLVLFRGVRRDEVALEAARAWLAAHEDRLKKWER